MSAPAFLPFSVLPVQPQDRRVRRLALGVAGYGGKRRWVPSTCSRPIRQQRFTRPVVMMPERGDDQRDPGELGQIRARPRRDRQPSRFFGLSVCADTGDGVAATVMPSRAAIVGSSRPVAANRPMISAVAFRDGP